MTTTQARQVLKCSDSHLKGLWKQGKIRKTKNGGRIDWDDHDVFALIGLQPDQLLTVAYARTEPVVGNGTQESAESRLEKQKIRLLDWARNYGVRIDLVIGDVRRVNRVRAVDGSPTSGYSALMQLLSERRVRTLVIESRDRICVGSSWEMFDWFLKVICGVDVVVINKHVVTTESREESKHWIADMLQIHKIMVGEIRDKKVIQQFWGGPDIALGKRAVKKLDEAMRQRNKLERTLGQESKRSKKVIDLDELF